MTPWQTSAVSGYGAPTISSSAISQVRRRLLPSPETVKTFVTLAIIFAAVRLVWDAALGPQLVPYPPDRPFASDDQYKNWAMILAVAYLLTCAPVVVFLGAYPILFALNPVLRLVESHRRLLLARAAWAFCVAAAIVYYEVVWRYLAYPLAQIIGMWVALLVAFAFAGMWVKAQRRRSDRVTSDK